MPAGALAEFIAAIKDPESSLAVAPVDLPISETLASIPRNEIPDMPDRIIAATAAAMGLPVVAADAKMRESKSVETTW